MRVRIEKSELSGSFCGIAMRRMVISLSEMVSTARGGSVSGVVVSSFFFVVLSGFAVLSAGAFEL